MGSFTRREILKGTALAAAGTFIPYFSLEKPIAKAESVSDRLRTGYIGIGGMGAGDAADFAWQTDVVALCDVDTGYLPVINVMNSDKMGSGPKDHRIQPDFYGDYRRILDRDDIDIVGISTPDHWHVKIAIEALQAGKHVFCQKPLTLTLEENKLIRKAAQQSDRVFQVGAQQRISRDQFVAAALLVQKGAIGKIKKVVCDVGRGPVSGVIPEAEPHETLDWNQWLGQAPDTPFIGGGEFSDGHWEKSRCHRLFRYFYDYSGGTVTDWGAHHIDSALMALGLQKPGMGPVRVQVNHLEMPVPYKNGYPTVSNQYNTPVHFDFSFQFSPESGSEYLADDFELHLVSDTEDGNGILVEGENGRFHVNRERIKGKPAEEKIPESFSEDDYRAINKGKPFENHKSNFIRCIHEGGLPASDVETHVLAMNCCHLAGIAARLNRTIEWDPAAEQIVGDDQAASFASRKARKGFELPAVD